jgi:hypothetical protein
MIRSVDIDYNWSIFLNGDYDIPAYSCATYQPQDMPDIYEPYGGFPDSYVLENTTIYQLWWDDKKLFSDLGELLDIDVVSISTIKQPCGSAVARHRDFFYKIKSEFPNDTRDPVRANIYLEDWDPGHMIQYEKDGNWLNSTHWKAGQGFTWDQNHEHISMNAGLKPKYTLQVSGFDIKE